MNEASLNALSARFGIEPSYYDLHGQAIETSIETKLALLRANGLHLDNDAMLNEAVDAYVTAEQDRWFPREIITSADYDYHCNFGLGAAWRIIPDDDLSDEARNALHQVALEGQATDHIVLPPLPAGIHSMTIDVAGRTEYVTIIASPIRAPSIKDLCGKEHIWGLNAALYALRSGRNSGLGDYEDLANLSHIAADKGASFIGINPVHSLGFSDEHAISPYSPSHRSFINSDHIALDQIEGLSGLPAAQKVLAEIEPRLAELRQSDVLDYFAHRDLHNAALRDLYTLFVQYAGQGSKARFSAFCQERGAELERFALFEALSDEHGTDWHDWSDALQRQDPIQLDHEMHRLAPQIEFYKWVQWVADEQLAKAQHVAKQTNDGLGLYLDLAVGARRGGAEAWCEAGSVAKDVSIGAPPDLLSPDGQNWGLTAFSPMRLAQDKYKALRKTYRQSMRHAGLLRIDHVLGLNRSFWIPDNGAPGGYIRQPLDSLLAVLTIEASRSNTALIGEDLGLVPDGFRQKVSDKGIYGYSVWQYERDNDGRFLKADELRPFSLACFSTHDTPTLNGFASGKDIDWWEKLGSISPENAETQHAERQKDVSHLEEISTTVDSNSDNENELVSQGEKRDLFLPVHAAMAQSPVSMISVQLDDILGEVEAQNLPGTIHEHPNWRRPCSVKLEDLPQLNEFKRLGEIMNKNGRGE